MHNNILIEKKNKMIVLCWYDYQNTDTYGRCSKAMGPLGNFDEMAEANFDHAATPISSSNGKPVLKTVNNDF